MKLHFRKIGNGQPLIILHGLFGSSDNWQTIGKKFAENNFLVYLVDLRNHGHSPHSAEHNYKAMSEDILELINDELLISPSPSPSLSPFILAHSMGGKAAMQSALDNPGKISKLIIVDIAPKKYVTNNREIAEVLFSIDLEKIKTRKEAEQILAEKISDNSTRQFLLKGLYWNENDKLDWRFNLKSIHNNIEKMGAAISEKNSFDKPCLFIRGENSTYILDNDFPLIKKCFPNAEIKTAPAAGHWVHACNPQWMFETCMIFLKRSVF